MKPILTFLLFLSVVVCLGQTGSKNYILSRTFKQTGAYPNDISKVNIQVQYVDGLGRPLQNVSVGQSPAGTDLVQPIEYDIFGRQVKQYLPYAAGSNGDFQSVATAAQAGFYSANSAGLEATDLARPYSETGFELSALNRPLTARAPGNKSALANISYGANIAGEVKRYDYASNANILLTISGNGDYAAGKLYRMQTIDENGKTNIEFSDIQGRLVCRKTTASGNEMLATYYVYDDYGQLRAVLQPMYQDNASTADFAFLYEYDNRGRVIVKKIPGAGLVNLVYDNFDRQVLSQDAAQQARGVWGFTKYDALNRAVLTGEITSASSRSVWQATLNASQAHHEDKTAGGLGFTFSNTLPNIAEANVLTVTYFDDYTFPKPVNLSYTNTYGVSALSNVKSLQTGSRVRMLAGANPWLASATYYDAEYRPIQTVSELYDLGAGAVERVSMQYKYDLAPVIAQEKTEQIIATGTNVHLKTYEYDHADRLLSVKEKVINGSKSREAVTLAQRYNALGQLQQKWFHSEDGINFRRRTTYTNNIRGWQTQGQTFYKTKENEPDSSFYNFALSYANGNNYTNGNISQMQWSGKAENTFTKGLAFTYDGANRMLGSTGLNNYKETESGISYDKNGNIKTLLRSGVVLDNLSYAYLGNRLSSVTDASGSNTGVKNGVSNYGYDGNGNMTSDGNRGAVLTYNYLNLPKTVTIGGKTLTYDYDASGTKHKYVADTLTAKYAGDFEYNQNNAFKRLSISEGQAVYRKDTIRFDYFLKDHLGNVRVVFDEKGRILQKTDYYPFGLEIDRNAPLQTPSARNNVNRFLYNGKELQVGTGFVDYGARMYMPEIGRWGAVDPLSEISAGFSPFVYGNDNPILMIDPNGMRTTYNWNSGQYEDEHGGNVGFEQAKHEYGIGQSGGCPPNCPQSVAKADATGRAQNTVTPQIADGGIALSQSEQATLYNADLKYQHGTQFSEYEKAAHIGIDIASMAQVGLLIKNVKAWITAAKGVGNSSEVLLNTSRQLQAKFKHAEDFGVLGNYSKANAGKFSSAINQHINSAGVKAINGTYRGQSVMHYLNPNTGLNVISNPSGQFISGWKLNPIQLQNVLKHGSL